MKKIQIKVITFLVLVLTLNLLPVSASESLEAEPIILQDYSSEEFLQPFGEAISDEDVELIDDGEDTEIIYDESDPIDQSLEEGIEEFLDLDFSDDNFYFASEIEEPEMLTKGTTEPTENPNTGIRIEYYSLIFFSLIIIANLILLNRINRKVRLKP